LTPVGFAGHAAPGAWPIPYATVPCVVGRFSRRASGVSRGRRCTAHECRPWVGSTPLRRARQGLAQPVLWRGSHRSSLRVSVTGLVAVGKAGGLPSPVARCLPACVPRRARSALCCPAYRARARGPRYLPMGVISSERRQAGGANRRGRPSRAVTQSSPAGAVCGEAGPCRRPQWRPHGGGHHPAVPRLPPHRLGRAADRRGPRAEAGKVSPAHHGSRGLQARSACRRHALEFCRPPLEKSITRRQSPARPRPHRACRLSRAHGTRADRHGRASALAWAAEAFHLTGRHARSRGHSFST
jgi:hypothetical protein